MVPGRRALGGGSEPQRGEDRIEDCVVTRLWALIGSALIGSVLLGSVLDLLCLGLTLRSVVTAIGSALFSPAAAAAESD